MFTYLIVAEQAMTRDTDVTRHFFSQQCEYPPITAQ